MTPDTDHVSAYCCLYASANDWLRVGLFLLKNGTDRQPILPTETWRDWLMPDLVPSQRRSGVYGLHIRHDVLDRNGADIAGPFAYMMCHRGQVMYLLPEQNAVLVRFGEKPMLLHSTLYDTFGRYVGGLKHTKDVLNEKARQTGGP